MSRVKYVAVWRDRLFIGPAYMCDPGTLASARKAISARIRSDRRPRRPLWAARPVSTMKAGDSVDVHIGRNGYHLWATYYIEKGV